MLKRIIESRLPGLAVAYRYLRDRRKAAKWQRVKTPFGFEMVGGEGMGESRLESGEIRLLFELLESKQLFVDAGANRGLFTLAARQRGVHCLAVEPNQENLQALLTNLSLNRFTDVEVFPLALSSRADLLPLYGGGEGASLEKGWGGMLATYAKLVPVNTLDHIVGARFCGQSMLVKIDVEGHEFAVLQGALGLLDRDPAPDWLLEHGFQENFNGQVNPHFRQLFELFWDRGYRCWTADDTRREVTPDDVERWIRRGERDFGYLNYLMSKGS